MAPTATKEENPVQVPFPLENEDGEEIASIQLDCLLDFPYGQSPPTFVNEDGEREYKAKGKSAPIIKFLSGASYRLPAGLAQRLLRDFGPIPARLPNEPPPAPRKVHFRASMAHEPIEYAARQARAKEARDADVRLSKNDQGDGIGTAGVSEAR